MEILRDGTYTYCKSCGVMMRFDCHKDASYKLEKHRDENGQTKDVKVWYIICPICKHQIIVDID